jgi:MSHA biogenesis protein MshP
MFRKPSVSSLRQQRGAALAVAVFIIVVMSLIGTAMVRILGDSSSATVSEVYGARAQAAARTGAELFLVDLFPHDAPVNSSLCTDRTPDPPAQARAEQVFSINGLTNCSTTVYCDKAVLSSPYSGVHFRIVAEGNCEVGDMTYSKEIILEASDGVY